MNDEQLCSVLFRNTFENFEIYTARLFDRKSSYTTHLFDVDARRQREVRSSSSRSSYSRRTYNSSSSSTDADSRNLSNFFGVNMTNIETREFFKNETCLSLALEQCGEGIEIFEMILIRVESMELSLNDKKYLAAVRNEFLSVKIFFANGK